MDVTIEAIEALRVPDAFAPVVGYRRFGIPWPLHKEEENHCLVQKGHRWTPKGPTVAECKRPGGRGHWGTACGTDAAPNQGCGCGLYAWIEIQDALRYYELTTQRGWVLASVIGWGRVFFDEDFWRSEQAQVVAFADPWDTHADKPEIVREKTARWLERTAENYGVPILSLEDLREYALMYGEEYVEEHG
jgi:hypothetical protein